MLLIVPIVCSIEWEEFKQYFSTKRDLAGLL